MNSDLSTLLFATQTPKDLKKAVKGAAGDLVISFTESTPEALSGSRQAVQSYVHTYLTLTALALEAAHKERPELVKVGRDGYALVDVNGSKALNSVTAIEQTAIEAPFSPWVAEYGPGPGVALNLISIIRSYLKGVEPLKQPKGTSAFPHLVATLEDVIKFRNHVVHALEATQPPVERIKSAFELNTTQMGKLFGVSRQAVDLWQEDGIPAARQSKVSTVASIADLLSQKIKNERLPGIVRKQAAAYCGKTILEMIELDKHEEVLEEIRRSFDWAVSA